MEDLDFFLRRFLIAWVSAKSQDTLIKIDQPNWPGQREYDRVSAVNHPFLNIIRSGQEGGSPNNHNSILSRHQLVLSKLI